MLPALPLEFADKLRLRNSDGTLDTEACVVALQCNGGRRAVAARFTAGSCQLDRETMTSPSNDLATEWKDALQLYPLYAALGREFVIELPALQ